MNELEQLTKLVRENDKLMIKLSENRRRIENARWYLNTPGANILVGNAALVRAQDRHSALLTQLRTNRIQALTIIGGTNAKEKETSTSNRSTENIS